MVPGLDYIIVEVGHGNGPQVGLKILWFEREIESLIHVHTWVYINEFIIKWWSMLNYCLYESIPVPFYVLQVDITLLNQLVTYWFTFGTSK